MRFHVISLPHTQTTKEYVNCAYTEKVRRFCMMMKGLGHTVYLYASEDNEAPVDELITCITKEQQVQALDGKHFTEAAFDNTYSENIEQSLWDKWVFLATLASL